MKPGKMHFSFLPSLFLPILPLLIGPAWSDLPLITNCTLYDTGVLGVAPNQTFLSSPGIVAPRLCVETFDKHAVDKTPFLFFNYIFEGVSTPMILRSDDLSLVYADFESGFPIVSGAQIQNVAGEDSLTFYQGVRERTYGNGVGMVLDKSYGIRYEVLPIDAETDRGVDEHEFWATEEGSVIVEVYETVEGVNLTSVGGPEVGKIVDSTFQEINPATGEKLFEWRARDHFDIGDGYFVWNEERDAELGFEGFHMNSVSKVDGNYLISSRHFSLIALLDGTTGEIIWVMGGKLNDFQDVSPEGTALNFAFQHQARIHAGDQLTLFDNHQLANARGCTVNCSRAMRLQLDEEAMTVDLVSEYFHPAGLGSIAMGSHEELESGNVLVSWGSNPTITEHKESGEAVMDIRLEPLTGSMRAFYGGNGPYRAFKMDWEGTPSWAPGIAVEGDHVYVSWNGATEVDRWAVMTSDDPDGPPFLPFVRGNKNAGS
ncbi:ASST-domain-containing protein [Zalerion maritima]|uniref:ASST-domain-containing protein n=1 Tax=Zalerion maritima TaxID=339359 RepID=A0AAD5RK24_9PEZI|nr:ASST-domain-containing protein [Zalerion maritima]